MPKRKRRTSYKPRKRVRRVGRRRLGKRRYFRKQGPLPNKLKGLMRYYNTGTTLNPGAGGAAAAYVFRANSLWDTDLTGIGHQPRGFDQLMSLYEEFCVIKAYIKVTFSSSSTTANRYRVGIAVKNSSIVSTDIRDYVEQGNQVSRILPAGAISGQTVTLKLSVNPNRFLGVSKPLSDQTVHGTASGNPQDAVYFHVFAADEGSADPPIINFTAEIHFVAMFIEPINIPLS